jgi:hypothetical protein
MAPNLIGAIKMASDIADGQRGIFLLTGSSDIFRSAQVQEKDYEIWDKVLHCDTPYMIARADLDYYRTSTVNNSTFPWTPFLNARLSSLPHRFLKIARHLIKFHGSPPPFLTLVVFFDPDLASKIIFFCCLFC